MSIQTKRNFFKKNILIIAQTVVVGLFDKMWMPAQIRRNILRYFFTNGVLVVLDNPSAKHEELDCLNIYVQQIGRSMLSKDLCKKTYAWSHAYFTLNDKGIEYLRAYFGLPANAAPLTLQTAHAETLDRRPEGGRRGGRGRGFNAPRAGAYRGTGRGRGRMPRGRSQGEEAQPAEGAEAPQTEQ